MLTLLDIQERLTGHLAGEASTDFHTARARTSAINEAYYHISEMFELWLGDNEAGPPQGPSYLGPHELPRFYNTLPPALVNQTDKPWGGLYPIAHPLISYYAAYRLYEDKGPEMYERATYWKERFRERIGDVERFKRRLHHAELSTGEATPDTWGGLKRLLQFNLGTSEMTPENAQRLFPHNIREGALKTAYRDITQEHELSEKEMVVTRPEAGWARAQTFSLPNDFLAPLSQAAISSGGEYVIGGEHPYALHGQGISFTIAHTSSGPFITFNNPDARTTSYTISYSALPPALSNNEDRPWGGTHLPLNKLIIIRAMRDLMRGQKETYNLSRFWVNEYDRELMEAKKYLRKFRLGQAHRLSVGHSGDMAVGARHGFIPINKGEGNG